MPAIGLLQAISPDPDRPDNDLLTYPSLDLAIKDHKSVEDILLRTFYTAEADSAAQLSVAVTLAEYELIQTASALQQAQTPDRQHELSQQFTAASVNLFGAPQDTAAAYLLEQLLTELCVLQTNYAVDAAQLDTLLHTYGEILAQSNAPRIYTLPFDEQLADQAAFDLGGYLRRRYADALGVFDGDPAARIEASDIVDLFEQALQTLQDQDDAWDEWQVMVTDDSSLAVNADTKRLVVGSHRASVELGELQGLFGHEVLVHALRATNGQQLSHELEHGLPGYIDAEEGFGCFVEHALSGRPPQKMYDRYLDIALALGVLDDQPRARHELFRLVYARKMVRAQAAGRQESPDHIERESWAHVNRIFRGTLGNDIVGVFTKDIAYYNGYQKIAAFFIDELAAGASLDDLWSLLILGKFDPTDATHVLELVANS